MREQDVAGVPFVCEKRGWSGKVGERDAQETEIIGGKRSEFFDKSMVARL